MLETLLGGQHCRANTVYTCMQSPHGFRPVRVDVLKVSVDQVAQFPCYLNTSGATTHNDNMKQAVVVVNRTT